MIKEKINFQNQHDEELKSILYLPSTRKPHSYAIFAHCFTCNKNYKNIKYISQSLTDQGFGVFSFDFTGLGDSEGEFSNTSFSHNIQDLIAAANYLKEKRSAPCLLVGHSLGGTASIYASLQIPSCKAVVCIGSPYEPEHVKHLLKENLDDIKNSGEAKVNIGGRDFKIKKSFIKDIEQQSEENAINKIDASLLILHSPQDKIVGISNAEKLYKAAKHPKSFVSLDGADHLLTNEEDSKYVGDVIASWSSRYLELPKEEEKLNADAQTIAHLEKEDDFTTEIKTGRHYLKADEPLDFGGKDLGPAPYDFVSSGLAACTAMTIQMYAKRKKWDLDAVEVHVQHQKEELQGTEKSDRKNKIDVFTRALKFNGNLDESQRDKLKDIANKCPVHKTLTSDVKVNTKLQ